MYADRDSSRNPRHRECNRVDDRARGSDARMSSIRRTTEEIREHLTAPVAGQLGLFTQVPTGLFVRPRGQRIQRVRGASLPTHTVYVGRPTAFGNPHRCSSATRERERAVQQYRQHLFAHPELVAAIRDQLGGVNLACWCPLDGGPCHADVLLDLAATTGDSAVALILLAG
jgi:hypothetical protein